eukprot:gene75-52_t
MLEGAPFFLFLITLFIDVGVFACDSPHCPPGTMMSETTFIQSFLIHHFESSNIYKMQAIQDVVVVVAKEKNIRDWDISMMQFYTLFVCLFFFFFPFGMQFIVLSVVFYGVLSKSKNLQGSRKTSLTSHFFTVTTDAEAKKMGGS